MTVLTVDLGRRVALQRELDLLRPVEGLTPQQAGELFLMTKSPNTRKAYSGDLKQWFEWCELLETDVFDADRRHMDLYLSHALRASGVDVAPLAIASVKRKVSAIRNFYKHCVDMRLLQYNPIPSDKALSVKGESPQALGPDHDETQAMLKACVGPVETAVVTVLFHQGLRVSEFCALDVSDMRQVRGYRVLRLHRKGNKAQDQRMSVAAVAAVDALGRSEGPLVASETGSRLTRNAVARIVSAVALRAGIRAAYTPHSLRHSCVTALLDAGMPIRDVQVYMGHASSTTTERYDLGRKVIDRSPAEAFDLATVGSARVFLTPVCTPTHATRRGGVATLRRLVPRSW